MEPLAEIREIYFRATRGTIARDFDRAIDLLKSMGSEEERERATVYMDGLAEMRAQWEKAKAAAGADGKKVSRPVAKPKSERRTTSAGKRKNA
jgi:hypothetical protein